MRDVLTVNAYLTGSDVLEEVGLVAQDTGSGPVEKRIRLRYEYLRLFVLGIPAVSKCGSSNLYPEPLGDHSAPSVVVKEAPSPCETVEEYARAEERDHTGKCELLISGQS